MKILLLPLLLAGACMSVHDAPAAEAVKDDAWVKQRVRQWQPTAQEKRWESIGWAPGLKSALRLAWENRRPVFLFTLDGRMNVGRC
ncbi:MAG: hypothetical protein KY468_18590 [Armatimonadetes bacterium]|nr:hypothetical protein [Armatimonadota bacterium]